MMKVVQCWDDGVINDIRLTEILRKYNAKATFNLCPGIMKKERVPTSWTDASFRGWSHHGFLGGRLSLNDIQEVFTGFELASHCWKHETWGYVSEADFMKGAIDARKYLEDAVQRECPGFAWPCGAYSPIVLKMMHEAGFAYGRTTENSNDPANYGDSMALKPNCHFLDNAFYDKYDKAKKDRIDFFYFWGHSYEIYEYDELWNQLENKIRMISEDPDVEWANVIDIVKK